MLKKSLATIMSLVLAVGLMPLPAFAQAGSALQATPVLQVGSLTVQGETVHPYTYGGFVYYCYIVDGGVAISAVSMDPGNSTSATQDLTLEIPDSVWVDEANYAVVQVGYNSVSPFSFPGEVAKIVIPDSVETLGYFNASTSYVQEIDFSNNHKITELPANFMAMWTYKYLDDSRALKKVTLPDSLVTIGAHAFQGCYNLQEVNFPASLRTIEKNAFLDTGLTSINLNNGLETIGDGAFYSYSSRYYWDGKIQDEDDRGIKATSIAIPDTVTNIGDYAFAFMPSYSRSLGNDVVYSTSSPKTSRYTSVTLGSGLKSIGDYAFPGLMAETLQLPSGLEKLGKYAFFDSPNLKTVTWSGGASAKAPATIDDSAFGYCKSLSSFTFPAGITSIGDAAFEETALTSVTLPEGVTTLGKWSFTYCTSLKSITLPSTLTTIGDSAFTHCTLLENVTLPSHLETIGADAFVGDTALTSITIPASVSKIGKNAFGDYNLNDDNTGYVLDAAGLTSVTIEQGDGSVSLDIAPGAFLGCKELAGATITLPERVTYLGSGAFWFIQNAKFVIENPNLSVYGGPYDAFSGSSISWIAASFNDVNHDGNISTSSNIQMPDPWGSNGYSGMNNGKYLPAANGSTVSYPAEMTRENQGNFYSYLTGVKYLVSGNEDAGRWPKFTDGTNTFNDSDATTDISSAEVSWGSLYEDYTGEPITFSGIQVRYDSKYLTEGEDYYVDYENNVNAGTAYVVVTGMGGYSGTKRKSFTIEPVSITPAITLAQTSYTYDGKAKTPAVTVKSGSTVLKPGTDYAVTYSNNVNAGTNTAKVTVACKGNYSFSAKALSFTISPKPIKPTIVLAATTYAYDGKAKAPGVTVKDGSTVLAASSYTVSYDAGRVNAGTYKVAVTLKGNYSGSGSASFAITPAASTIRLATQSKPYTGAPLAYTADVSRTGSSGKVTYAYYRDAACSKPVSAANVKAVGTYYVKATVAAAGNYAAATSVPVKFTITKAANPLSVKAKTATVSYSKLKKKAQMLAVSQVIATSKKGQGTVTYTKKSGNGKIAVDKKTGKVTVKKGLKKNAYKVKVAVKAAGNVSYKSATKTVTFTIKVK